MLANNPALSFLGFLFLAGALLFALGSWLARRAPESQPGVSEVPVLELIAAEMAATEAATEAVPAAEPPPVAPRLPWTYAVAETDETLAPEMRLDMIERLAMVGAPWCIDTLNAAVREETDDALRDAAERALLVIACRPDSF